MTPAESKHTPGPWHVEPLQATHGADLAICGDGYIVAVVQHDPEIQPAEEVDGENVRWHTSDKPNAHLIAAAPAMYEALRACEERLTAWQAGGALQVETTLAAIQAARAALAAAEGVK